MMHMKRLFYCKILFVICLSALQSALLAQDPSDKLFLIDKDRITGKVIAVDGEHIEIKSEKEIRKIPRDSVVMIIYADNTVVHFNEMPENPKELKKYREFIKKVQPTRFMSVDYTPYRQEHFLKEEKVSSVRNELFHYMESENEEVAASAHYHYFKNGLYNFLETESDDYLDRFEGHPDSRIIKTFLKNRNNIKNRHFFFLHKYGGKYSDEITEFSDQTFHIYSGREPENKYLHYYFKNSEPLTDAFGNELIIEPSMAFSHIEVGDVARNRDYRLQLFVEVKYMLEEGDEVNDLIYMDNFIEDIDLSGRRKFNVEKEYQDVRLGPFIGDLKYKFRIERIHKGSYSNKYLIDYFSITLHYKRQVAWNYYETDDKKIVNHGQ